MLNNKSPLMEEVNLKVPCKMCGDVHEIVVIKNDFMKWYNGELTIQNALPYLTIDERELLISHICNKCYDELFGGEE